VKLTNTNDIKQLNIKALIYGKSGAGKTSSAKTLPVDRTFIISAESGLLPLKDMGFKVAELESWADMNEVYTYLTTDGYKEKYDYIFIDSLTEINEICKDNIVKKERPEKRGNVGKVYDDILDMNDWGLLYAKMSRVIRAFRDLPYNIVFTCLEYSNKNERTGAIEYLPALNGQLRDNIGQYFDEVFHIRSDEKSGGGDNKTSPRFFLTDKTDEYLAKDRSGMLDKIEVADLSKVINKIKSTGGKK